MSWQEVEVKIGTDSLLGVCKNNMLHIPSVKNLGEAITVNGKNHQVESYTVDHRDNIFKIKLAMASPTKEKSDDKPTKRAD